MCCSYRVVLGVGARGGLPVRRHSYRGHTVELWRASDWLKNDKAQLKVKQSRQTRVYLGFIRPKTGTMRFGPMAGLVRCAFHLIVQCTCFWPQTDQVYLFWDAAHKKRAKQNATKCNNHQCIPLSGNTDQDKQYMTSHRLLLLSSHA